MNKTTCAIQYKIYIFTVCKDFRLVMQKFILLIVMLFGAGMVTNGQSFLQIKYGASFPAGNFGENTNLDGSGHAQTGLGLQAEYYNMFLNPVGIGLHYSFSFNSADFLKTGYRYAETYSNIVAGKYAMHDITGIVVFKAFSSSFLTTSIRISGGTSFISYPEVTKRFYENEQLSSEEVLFNKINAQKYLYGIGAALRYGVSDNTGISFTIDYQNRFGGNQIPNERNYNIEQVFVLLGIDFQLGKK